MGAHTGYSLPFMYWPYWLLSFPGCLLSTEKAINVMGLIQDAGGPVILGEPACPLG